ncbi:MAG: hypothetical protein WCN95_09350 [bacterium]
MRTWIALVAALTATLAQAQSDTNQIPAGLPLAAITNGMTRLDAEKIFTPFTNHTEMFLNPGGIYSKYWMPDGSKVVVIFDWTGTSLGKPKASPLNRVKAVRLEPAETAPHVENTTLPKEAPTAALQWLKEHQSEDGSWGSNPTNRPALTGLALLAYLAHGKTPASKEFGMTVENGLRRLLYDVEASKTNGTPGGIENEYISTDAIVTYALAEAYGMTQMILLREPTSNMTCRVIASKHPTPIWTTRAVKSAIYSGIIEVSEDDKKRVLESCLASIKGTNLLSRAGAVWSIMWLGQWDDIRCAGEMEAVTQLAHLDWNGHHESLPMLTWFIATQVLSERGGQAWNQWNRELLPAVVRNRQEDGRWCIPVSQDGSGVKERAMWGESDSDIYATSLIAILFTSGRHLPALRPEDVRRPRKTKSEADAKLEAQISL